MSCSNPAPSPLAPSSQSSAASQPSSTRTGEKLPRHVWEERAGEGVGGTAGGEASASSAVRCVSCGRSTPCGCVWQRVRQQSSAAAAESMREAHVDVPGGMMPRGQDLSREREREGERARAYVGGGKRNSSCYEHISARGWHAHQTTPGVSCRPQPPRPQDALPPHPRWQQEGMWRGGGCSSGWAPGRR